MYVLYSQAIMLTYFSEMTKYQVNDYSGIQNITYYIFIGWGDLPPADNMLLDFKCRMLGDF